ncbi:hypothetical protein GQ607_004470 [Colletotrichum asianum]|uniref:Uncharacterized protein n=1 Tax=Colletotrichum asianum TaxID=702518 RepID=A0A8H3WHW0_9PEZI|nr:hypothetical protein GQ607_004470 [Colletotrichum asianum]
MFAHSNYLKQGAEQSAKMRDARCVVNNYQGKPMIGAKGYDNREVDTRPTHTHLHTRQRAHTRIHNTHTHTTSFLSPVPSAWPDDSDTRQGIISQRGMRIAKTASWGRISPWNASKVADAAATEGNGPLTAPLIRI